MDIIHCSQGGEGFGDGFVEVEIGNWKLELVCRDVAVTATGLDVALNGGLKGLESGPYK